MLYSCTHCAYDNSGRQTVKLINLFHKDYISQYLFFGERGVNVYLDLVKDKLQRTRLSCRSHEKTTPESSRITQNVGPLYSSIGKSTH